MQSKIKYLAHDSIYRAKPVFMGDHVAECEVNNNNSLTI